MRIPAIAATAFVIAVAGPAHANVIYDFTGDMTGGIVSPFSARLVVTDEAVQSGALKFKITGTKHEFIGIGDYLGLVSFTDNQKYTELFGPDHAYGTMSMDVTFPLDGTLAGSLGVSGIEQDLFLYGSGVDWSGSFSADWAGGCWNTRCSITGAWVDPPADADVVVQRFALADPVEVPDVPTLPLFSAALAMLGLASRRVSAMLRAFWRWAMKPAEYDEITKLSGEW